MDNVVHMFRCLIYKVWPPNTGWYDLDNTYTWVKVGACWYGLYGRVITNLEKVWCYFGLCWSIDIICSFCFDSNYLLFKDIHQNLHLEIFLFVWCSYFLYFRFGYFVHISFLKIYAERVGYSGRDQCNVSPLDIYPISVDYLGLEEYATGICNWLWRSFTPSLSFDTVYI